MTKTLLTSFLFLIIFSCKNYKSDGSEFNSLPKNEAQIAITDFSNIFTFDESVALSKKLINYESKTSNQIVILTIDSIKPYTDIQKYATDIGNFWGVGQRKKDNGLVIVLSKPLRKVSISTGYYTAKVLTDSICKNIIDYTMLPSFKKGNYYEGIDKAIDSIFKKWHH